MRGTFSNLQLCDACRVLFPNALIHFEFLQQLRLPSVKKSFRELAKMHHPDCCIRQPETPTDGELFRKADQAYQLLCAYIRERDLTQAAKPRSRGPEPAQESSAKQQPSFWAFRRKPPVRPTRTPNDVYYIGPLPTFRLKLGLFLYYKGSIPYHAVVKALIWQRDIRPPLGELAIAWGWLEPRMVSVIRSTVERNRSFGEKAVELGLLTQSQVGVLLLHQRLMQAHIGRYFVAKGYLTEKELEKCLQEQLLFNRER